MILYTPADWLSNHCFEWVTLMYPKPLCIQSPLCRILYSVPTMWELSPARCLVWDTENLIHLRYPIFYENYDSCLLTDMGEHPRMCGGTGHNKHAKIQKADLNSLVLQITWCFPWSQIYMWPCSHTPVCILVPHRRCIFTSPANSCFAGYNSP